MVCDSMHHLWRWHVELTHYHYFSNYNSFFVWVSTVSINSNILEGSFWILCDLMYYLWLLLDSDCITAGNCKVCMLISKRKYMCVTYDFILFACVRTNKKQNTRKNNFFFNLHHGQAFKKKHKKCLSFA